MMSRWRFKGHAILLLKCPLVPSSLRNTVCKAAVLPGASSHILRPDYPPSYSWSVMAALVSLTLVHPVSSSSCAPLSSFQSLLTFKGLPYPFCVISNSSL